MKMHPESGKGWESSTSYPSMRSICCSKITTFIYNRVYMSGPIQKHTNAWKETAKKLTLESRRESIAVFVALIRTVADGFTVISLGMAMAVML